MAGGLESIMQGVITQGTALQSRVRQTSQDIIADAYEQYSGSSSARIANNKIDLSENIVDDYTFGSSLLDNEDNVSSNTVSQSTSEGISVSHELEHHRDDDDDDCCGRGWQRDDHPGRGRARGRDHCDDNKDKHCNDDRDKHCDNDGRGRGHHCD